MGSAMKWQHMFGNFCLGLTPWFINQKKSFCRVHINQVDKIHNILYPLVI